MESRTVVLVLDDPLKVRDQDPSQHSIANIGHY